jgi:hypothetical protein
MISGGRRYSACVTAREQLALARFVAAFLHRYRWKVESPHHHQCPRRVLSSSSAVATATDPPYPHGLSANTHLGWMRCLACLNAFSWSLPLLFCRRSLLWQQQRAMPLLALQRLSRSSPCHAPQGLAAAMVDAHRSSIASTCTLG